MQETTQAPPEETVDSAAASGADLLQGDAIAENRGYVVGDNGQVKEVLGDKVKPNEVPEGQALLDADQLSQKQEGQVAQADQSATEEGEQTEDQITGEDIVNAAKGKEQELEELKIQWKDQLNIDFDELDTDEKKEKAAIDLHQLIHGGTAEDAQKKLDAMRAMIGAAVGGTLGRGMEGLAKLSEGSSAEKLLYALLVPGSYGSSSSWRGQAEREGGEGQVSKGEFTGKFEDKPEEFAKVLQDKDFRKTLEQQSFRFDELALMRVASKQEGYQKDLQDLIQKLGKFLYEDGKNDEHWAVVSVALARAMFPHRPNPQLHKDINSELIYRWAHDPQELKKFFFSKEPAKESGSDKQTQATPTPNAQPNAAPQGAAAQFRFIFWL